MKLKELEQIIKESGNNVVNYKDVLTEALGEMVYHNQDALKHLEDGEYEQFGVIAEKYVNRYLREVMYVNGILDEDEDDDY